MLKQKRRVSSSAARPVFVLRHVRNGASRLLSASPGVEGQVAVHHPRDADRAVGRGGDVVALAHVRDQGGVGAPQAGHGLVEGVGPQTALQMVLPGVAAGGEHLVVGADQDGLDAGRTEFDAERGVGGGDGGAGVDGHVYS